ncbi:hypothetical protein DFQ27_004549 [Actinomortierella ambigua]|uniref:Uncharacterized protein n=1 Tax=Actinomortierella ambigua TaxID=1343610 RepID=A0A9P6U385_9FUNG|nr:hypothetical protein DFQ27_004549 [Actinomortierella ambigua]
MSQIGMLEKSLRFSVRATFQEFPPRQQVVGELVQFIDRRPRMAHYYIDAWTFGYEEIWIGLSQAFNSQVHVTPYLYELYAAINDLLANRILPYLTLDGRAARFHSCRLGPDCGYGAGLQQGNTVGREVIRIQPNVSWFSALMQQERLHGDRAPPQAPVFEGKVAGRSTRFSILERLPPCLSRRDPHFYYLNFACHSSLKELEQLVELVAPRALFPCVLHRDADMRTYRESNRQIVELLARHVHHRTFALDVEENNVPGQLRQWQVQQRQRRRGVLHDRHQVLDLDGVVVADGQPTHPSSELKRPSSSCVGRSDILLQGKSDPLLSPRSRHLFKKMQRLKRQLVRAKSEEADPQHKGRVSQDSESGSSLGAGPLTLDMDELERKRLWWLQEDRGDSTTLEEADEGENEEEDEGEDEKEEDNAQEHISCGHADFQGPLSVHHNNLDRLHLQMQTQQENEWLEQSTVELSRTGLEDGATDLPHPPPSAQTSTALPQQGQQSDIIVISSDDGSQTIPSVLSLDSSRDNPFIAPSSLVSSPPGRVGLQMERPQQHCSTFKESPMLPTHLGHVVGTSSRLSGSVTPLPSRAPLSSSSSSSSLFSSSTHRLAHSNNIFANVALSPPRTRSVAVTSMYKSNTHVTTGPLNLLARSFTDPGSQGRRGWSFARPTMGVGSTLDGRASTTSRSSPSSPGSKQLKRKRRHNLDRTTETGHERRQDVDPQYAESTVTIWVESSSSSNSSSEGEDETTAIDHQTRSSVVGEQRASSTNAGISPLTLASGEHKRSSPSARASGGKVLPNDDDEEMWLEYQDLSP